MSVSFVGISSSYQAVGGPMSVAVPAGTVAGDFLVLTVHGVTALGTAGAGPGSWDLGPNYFAPARTDDPDPGRFVFRMIFRAATSADIGGQVTMDHTSPYPGYTPPYDYVGPATAVLTSYRGVDLDDPIYNPVTETVPGTADHSVTFDYPIGTFVVMAAASANPSSSSFSPPFAMTERVDLGTAFDVAVYDGLSTSFTTDSRTATSSAVAYYATAGIMPLLAPASPVLAYGWSVGNIKFGATATVPPDN